MKTSKLFYAVVCFSLPFVWAASASAQVKFTWQGYTWHTREAVAQGPGPNDWSASNVWVDAKGYLHLKLSRTDGKWSCAEVWTDQSLGFGTYQCQVEGPIDKLDPNIVFSMFSYQGPDNVKEIDIEFAKWSNPNEKNAWWTVYPNDSTGKKTFTGFNLKLNGTYSTSRYRWTKDGVHYWMLGGNQPITSLKNLLQEWDDKPVDPEHSITQTPMPLHFNLWLTKGDGPTDGKPVEIIVKSFTKS